LRRTYGFFEAGAWISRQDAVRFGVKKPDTRWSGF
jgi:hypothetical protein